MVTNIQQKKKKRLSEVKTLCNFRCLMDSNVVSGHIGTRREGGRRELGIVIGLGVNVSESVIALSM